MEYLTIIQNGWQKESREADKDVYFDDGERKIDMVLAYEDEDDVEAPSSVSNQNEEATADNESSVSYVRRSSVKLLHSLNNVSAAYHHPQMVEKRKNARKTFEANLVFAGLNVEYETKQVREKLINLKITPDNAYKLQCLSNETEKNVVFWEIL